MLGSVAGLPAWHPPREVLELAELVLTGSLDSVPVRVDVPVDLVGAEEIVLEDAEGTPVALLRPVGAGADPADENRPALEPLRGFSHGPLRSGRRRPELVRAGWPAGTPVLAVPVTSMLTVAAVEAARARAATSGEALLWLAVFGSGRPAALPAAGLWRAVRQVSEETAAAGLRSVAVPVAVPLVAGLSVEAGDEAGAADAADTALVAEVARSFGATSVLPPESAPAAAAPPAAPPHPAFAGERERAVPPPHRRGVTVFFTGLSGSGKSTLAKALADELAERSDRTVSLLDGDEVRRMLSAGLGFSRADRDLNIRRIGFVATEIGRHGGMAICAPIAPFASTREQVRADVETVGDLVLIHVSTPLAECERRDRKGLYAKARQGLIADFTGISSPYEIPLDADLRLDTSRIGVAEAVAAIWQLLSARGYLTSAERA